MTVGYWRADCKCYYFFLIGNKHCISCGNQNIRLVYFPFHEKTVIFQSNGIVPASSEWRWFLCIKCNIPFYVSQQVYKHPFSQYTEITLFRRTRQENNPQAQCPWDKSGSFRRWHPRIPLLQKAVTIVLSTVLLKRCLLLHWKSTCACKGALNPTNHLSVHCHVLGGMHPFHSLSTHKSLATQRHFGTTIHRGRMGHSSQHILTWYRWNSWMNMGVQNIYQLPTCLPYK